jgi:VIT1/CCC1 family predicted Fe2+/Mn2+ transporter
MLREKHRQRRRKVTPPREGILSDVLGDFLDPIDAIFTTFFSILFALLFTLSYAILIERGAIESSLSSTDGQKLFTTILGAVAAWAIIDGILYVLAEVMARKERHRLLQYVQASDSDEAAAAAIAGELDFILEPITSDAQRQALYQDIRKHLRQAEPQAVRVHRDDVLGGLSTTVLSVVAVLPSLLPLLLVPGDIGLAIRISNAVSFLVIFAAGYQWGVHTDTSPWKTGLLLASVCLAMVLIAMAAGDMR